MTPATRTLIVRPDDTDLQVEKGATEAWWLELDWSRQLPGDTLSSSTWESLDNLPVGTPAFTDDRSSTMISGGNFGDCYRLKNTVVTVAGETFTRQVRVDVTRE